VGEKPPKADYLNEPIHIDRRVAAMLKAAEVIRGSNEEYMGVLESKVEVLVRMVALLELRLEALSKEVVSRKRGGNRYKKPEGVK
jgi:hypothetical protein